MIGRLAGLAYALWRAGALERARKAEAETDAACELDPQPVRTILNLALPASLTFSLIAIEAAVINELLKQMPRSTEAVAAYSIYYRIGMFALQPIIAMAVAMLPFAARRVGQNDWRAARDGLQQASLTALTYSLVLVAPVMFFAAGPIAGWLAEDPLTADLARFSLKLVPLMCLSGAMFLLCRPVFEAMNRGRPGLVMAMFRYLLLTAPLAWAGMAVARGADISPLHGLIGGLLVASTISSIVFYVWARRELSRCSANAAAT